jgi:hypothetical protein
MSCSWAQTDCNCEQLRDMQTLGNIRFPFHFNTGDISPLALLPLLLSPQAGSVTVTDRRGSVTIPKQASSGSAPMLTPLSHIWGRRCSNLDPGTGSSWFPSVGSSFRMVTGYGLNDGTLNSGRNGALPVLRSVQTNSGNHSISYSVDAKDFIIAGTSCWGVRATTRLCLTMRRGKPNSIICFCISFFFLSLFIYSCPISNQPLGQMSSFELKWLKRRFSRHWCWCVVYCKRKHFVWTLIALPLPLFWQRYTICWA